MSQLYLEISFIQKRKHKTQNNIKTCEIGNPVFEFFDLLLQLLLHILSNFQSFINIVIYLQFTTFWFILTQVLEILLL